MILEEILRSYDYQYIFIINDIYYKSSENIFIVNNNLPY